ncbi:hypothetical protein RSF12_000405 [Yersinia enterocolitica]|nr:hypothetical protein [Yersinia enterocolitica]
MNNIFESDDGFVDLDAIMGGRDESSENIPQYKAWHKPRKQWVRHKQWWNGLDTMLSRNRAIFENVETIKYFGLPGGDLLDIEYICQKFQEKEDVDRKEFLFHGITNDRKDKNTADSRLSKIYDYSFVSHSSTVEHYEFSALDSKESLIWKGVEKSGFFHMINLDFCDSLFKEKTLSAMMALLDFQFDHKNGIPWLLCLTTRIDKSGITEELLVKLNELLINFSQEEDVRENINQHFENAYENIGTILLSDTSEVTTLPDILQVCFVLWIIENAFAKNVKVELCSSARYNVHSGNKFPDMSSLVFRFTHKKPTPFDVTRLTSSSSDSANMTAQNKASWKNSALRKISEFQDLDIILATNEELFQQYALEMKNLLIKCGWNVSGYDEFIRGRSDLNS